MKENLWWCGCASIQRLGTLVYFKETSGQYRLLIVDQTKQPKPDLVKDWETPEAALISGYRNYDRISIHAVSYWDKAADWEYIRTTDNGYPLDVSDRPDRCSPAIRLSGWSWATA